MNKLRAKIKSICGNLKKKILWNKLHFDEKRGITMTFG
jgi:hypothetical protein